jgi:hypothetical protein
VIPEFPPAVQLLGPAPRMLRGWPGRSLRRPGHPPTWGAFPKLDPVGSRVWRDSGGADQEPIGDTKTGGAAGVGGTIIRCDNPNLFITGNPLYTVRWDDGTETEHRWYHLFCIGRFGTRAEFEAAVELEGPVELTVGRQGGFRKACMRVKYDGVSRDVALYQGYRDL